MDFNVGNLKKGEFLRFKENNYLNFKVNNSGINDISKGVFTLTLFAFILTIFLLPMASAAFNLGTPNYSIEKIYGPSQNATGWVNISFSSEPLNSLLTHSGSSINLSEILKKNPAYNYSCSPVGCVDDYVASNSGTTKQTNLDTGNSSTYGIKLTGNIQSIESFGFILNSNSGPSCTNQVEVDFLDDSIADFKNTNVRETGTCTGLKSYGCFNSNLAAEEIEINAPVCEKINLSDSPGFVLGAWIKKTGSTGTLKAAIHKKISQSSAQEVATCTLPDPSTSGEEVSCSVNYAPVGSNEHYVCIYLGSATGNYVTKGYGTGTSSNLCGFYGTPIKPENAAYQIFAQGKQFDGVGAITMNDSLADGKSFATKATDYIRNRYGNLNCGSAGCVIPVKVRSNVANQEITLSSLQVLYQKEIGRVTESNFYDLQTTAARVTSGFKKLYLDQAGFTVPNSIGNHTFSLDLDSQGVFSERIEVKDVPIIQSVTPTQVAAAFPTEFTISFSSGYNISKFSWDFGDNTYIITTGNAGNKTTHTYNQTGEYNLKITVTDSRQLSSTKTFLINVTSPRNLIAINLAELKESLKDIKTDISSLDAFSKNAINASLGLAAIEASISSLETRYNAATSDVQYSGIVTDLLKLKLPEAIFKTRDATSVPLISGPDYVDLNVLKNVAGGTFNESDEEGYIEAALFWQRENLETDVDFNEFSGRYQNKIEPIAKTFKISLSEKKDIGYDYYLIMPELEGFWSDSRFRVDNESGYIYINMKDQNTVSFSTTEDVDFTDLPAFISPAISRLSLGETILPEEKKISRWLIFGLVIVFLLVVGVIVYIVMQEWYKRKYEHHLFPNKNDLYNMANYIHNAKKKGMSNNDIESNLKKAGWSGEKIRYAMRKYAGKRTGMLEIPITKAVKKVEGK